MKTVEDEIPSASRVLSTLLGGEKDNRTITLNYVGGVFILRVNANKFQGISLSKCIHAALLVDRM